MGADASSDAVRALTVKLGLDQPLHYRYVHWIKGMLTGDLGAAYAYYACRRIDRGRLVR